MSKGKVLLAAPVHAVLTEALRHHGYEIVDATAASPQETLRLIADCTGVITSTRLQLDKFLLDQAKRLRWIGRMGSGMEVIDTAYAASKGIVCFSSPEGNCNAVAEHALGMLLSVLKRISYSQRQIMDGQWLREENRGEELDGKTVGIIGVGHTGRAFAKKLSGFDLRILGYDKYNPKDFPPNVIPCSSLSPIFEQADIVSFHVPLQPDTLHYFNEGFLSSFSKPIVLINTSRGSVVDTGVLLQGIRSGRLRAACIDVLEDEPLPKMSEERQEEIRALAALPQVVITPHIAGYSKEAVYKMSLSLLSKIVTEP